MEILDVLGNKILILYPEDLNDTNQNLKLRGIHFGTCYYPKGYQKQFTEFVKNNIASFGFTIDNLFTNFIRYEKRRTY